MRPLALTLALALAGCVTPSSAEGAPTEGGAPAGGHTVLEIAASACQIGALGFLVPPEHAQAHVPDWAVAADAQSVLGTPAPTQRGFVLVEVYRCASHTLAGEGGGDFVEVSVAIEAPDVPGEREEAAFDWFQPIYGAPAAADAALASIRWDHFEASIGALDATALPTGSALGTWSASSPEGLVVEARVAGPAPVAIGGINRFWQVHEEGTSYIDYDIAVAAGTGAAECALAGVVSEVTGLASCMPGEAVGFVAPAVDFTATAHFFPGVQPSPPS